MNTATLGNKRTCPECRARFYDLGRRPAVCPKCYASIPNDARLPKRTPSESAKPPPETAEDGGEDIESVEDTVVRAGDALEGDDDAVAPKFDENALGDGGIDEEDTDVATVGLTDIDESAGDEEGTKT